MFLLEKERGLISNQKNKQSWYVIKRNRVVYETG